MKTIVKLFAAAAVSALCCLTACNKHTPYRPNNTSGTENQGGNHPGGGGNTPGDNTVKAKLRSDWVIQYKGREDYTEPTAMSRGSSASMSKRRAPPIISYAPSIRRFSRIITAPMS